MHPRAILGRVGPIALLLSSFCTLGFGQFSQTGRSTATDGLLGDQFGRCVAVDGTTAVVGAPGTDDVDPSTSTCFSGAAYVFELISGTWTQTQRLVASDQLCRANFGTAVAISGDTLIVGARWHDGASMISTNCNSGAAYVFERVGTQWVEQQVLLPSAYQCGMNFGTAVAIDGEWLVVGAHRDANPSIPLPSAFVFRMVAGAWIEDQQLIGSNITPNDFFGTSVGVSGETLVVGATFAPGLGNGGAGYVFVRSGGGWIEEAILDIADSSVGGLGSQAVISGDTVALATVSDFCSSSICRGAAVVWRREAGTWTREATFTELPSNGDDYFGTSLALDRDTLVVGDERADDPNPPGGTCDAGALYVFTRTGTHWAGDRIIAAPPICGENFGHSVAVSGDHILTGCPPADGVTISAGALYTLERPNPGVVTCVGTACPCGNDEATAGCANSTGSGGALFAVGSASIAADDLQLRTTGVPADANCLFVVGFPQTPTPIYDGLTCVASPTLRVSGVLNTGAGATAAASMPLTASGAAWSPGTTAAFQCLYRDKAGPCGTSANMTHGLALVLVP